MWETLGRDKFAAELLTRKPLAFDQHGLESGFGEADRKTRAGGARTDYSDFQFAICYHLFAICDLRFAIVSFSLIIDLRPAMQGPPFRLFQTVVLRRSQIDDRKSQIY